MFKAPELQAKRQGRLCVELHVRTFCSCEYNVLVVRLQTFECLTQTAFFVLYPVHRVDQFKYIHFVENLRQAQYITCRVDFRRSEEHTSELQSRFDLVCRLLLEKKTKANR